MRDSLDLGGQDARLPLRSIHFPGTMENTFKFWTHAFRPYILCEIVSYLFILSLRKVLHTSSETFFMRRGIAFKLKNPLESIIQVLLFRENISIINGKNFS